MMEKKFIRIQSVITLAVIAFLDCAVIGFAVFAVKKLIEAPNAVSVFFALIEVLAIITGILVTKEILKNGIYFFEDKIEFTCLDNDNIFYYRDIAEIETFQDTKASLKKNFIDRHTLIIITLNSGKVVTVDVGLCTKVSLNKIRNELSKHIENIK